MYTDQCLCIQTSFPKMSGLSVTSPRLYGGPQTNKISNIKDKTEQNTSQCGIWGEWNGTGIFIYRWRYVMLATDSVFKWRTENYKSKMMYRCDNLIPKTSLIVWLAWSGNTFHKFCCRTLAWWFLSTCFQTATLRRAP